MTTRTLTLLCSISVALAAIVGGAQDLTPSGTGRNPVVLRIDGEPVRAAEISLVMLNLQAQLKAVGQEMDTRQLMDQATQRVIEQRLLAREARRAGLSPDPARIQQMLAAAEQQAGGAEQLAANLAAAGSSRAELEKVVEHLELSRVLIAEQVAPTIEVSDEEARRFYDEHQDFFQSGDAAVPFDAAAAQARALAGQQKTAEAVRALLERLASKAVVEFTQG